MNVIKFSHKTYKKLNKVIDFGKQFHPNWDYVKPQIIQKEPNCNIIYPTDPPKIPKGCPNPNNYEVYPDE